MAQKGASMAVAIFYVVATYFVTVTAQGFEKGAPAPAPSMDKGVAYSLGISGAMICFSLLLSMIGLLKH